MSFLGKLFGKKEKETLDQGLEKTKLGFLERISKAIIGKTSVDDEVLDQLEEALIGADVGVDTTLALIEKIQERVKKDKYVSTVELNKILHEEIVFYSSIQYKTICDFISRGKWSRQNYYHW